MIAQLNPFKLNITYHATVEYLKCVKGIYKQHYSSLLIGQAQNEIRDLLVQIADQAPLLKGTNAAQMRYHYELGDLVFIVSKKRDALITVYYKKRRPAFVMRQKKKEEKRRGKALTLVSN